MSARETAPVTPLVEHFFRPLGILQGGFFYKQLYDPIYPTITLLAPPDPNACDAGPLDEVLTEAAPGTFAK